MKKMFLLLAVGMLIVGSVNADVSFFSIDQTFSQGSGVGDLPATDISLGSAGTFTLDPGFSNIYFDFEYPGGVGGTFSTTNDQLEGYYFLDSYAQGETIGSGNFGNHASIGSDWDTILVNGQTSGVWNASHDGYLGFITNTNSYGWIEYSYTRVNSISTISLLDGAYESSAGANIIAGVTPVPVPGAFLLGSFGVGMVGWIKRRK